jgi:hypothetical protein
MLPYWQYLGKAIHKETGVSSYTREFPLLGILLLKPLHGLLLE